MFLHHNFTEFLLLPGIRCNKHIILVLKQNLQFHGFMSQSWDSACSLGISVILRRNPFEAFAKRLFSFHGFMAVAMVINTTGLSQNDGVLRQPR